MSSWLQHFELQAFRAAVAAAQRHFETHPLYPSVRVQIADRFSELKKQFPEQALGFFTAERLSLALAIFDINAHAYLRLAGDMDAHKAFALILDDGVKTAWENYCGYSADRIRPNFNSEAYRKIEERKHHWLTQGYRQLASS